MHLVGFYYADVKSLSFFILPPPFPPPQFTLLVSFSCNPQWIRLGLNPGLCYKQSANNFLRFGRTRFLSFSCVSYLPTGASVFEQTCNPLCVYWLRRMIAEWRTLGHSLLTANNALCSCLLHIVENTAQTLGYVNKWLRAVRMLRLHTPFVFKLMIT